MLQQQTVIAYCLAKVTTTALLYFSGLFEKVVYPHFNALLLMSGDVNKSCCWLDRNVSGYIQKGSRFLSFSLDFSTYANKKPNSNNDSHPQQIKSNDSKKNKNDNLIW